MPAGGSCLLGSINLAEFVTKHKIFDYNSFEETVRIAVKALNNVLDEGLPLHPLQEQRDSVKNWRQIGIGIFGLADMLIKMGIVYGSEESIALCDEIGYIMAKEAIKASSDLADKFGSYPKYKKEAINQSEFFDMHYTPITGLRNSQLLTIAPTGSISTMLGVSGGIEPIYANYYERKTESLHGHDEYYKVYTPIVKKYMDENNVKDDKFLPDFFVTAQTLDYKNRIYMQAIWQKHIDASISSTINVPNDFTVEQVEDLYILAWKHELKGVTIFRDGCQRTGVLTTSKAKNNQNNFSQELPRGVIIKADDNCVGKKRTLYTGCVDANTEYFNGCEWKKISDYIDGDLVLQYNKDGTATLVKPLQYIKRKSNGQYHIRTKYGLDMMISPDHRNVTFLKDNKFEIMTTEEIINKHNSTINGFARKFKLCFDYSGGGIDLTDNEIRLSVAIFADGCFYSPTSKKCLISVNKKRKRDRLINILNQSNIDYSEHIDSDGYYNIKFYPPLEGRVKKFPKEWYNCSKHQLKIIFDEVFRWDGYEKANNEYTTIYKENADFIQFVCAALGKRGSIYKDTRHKNTTYRVDWSNRILTSFVTSQKTKKKKFNLLIPEDGYDYCFSVPSTMLVLRRNDRIFITGNCGALHCTAFFDADTGDLLETYLSKGSQGGCNNYMTGLSRLISLSARGGVDVFSIVDQLQSAGTCPSYAIRTATKHDTSKGSSCPVAVGNALLDMYYEMQSEISDDECDIEYEQQTISNVEQKNEIYNSNYACPECGAELVFEGGCNTCKECGYSKCS